MKALILAFCMVVIGLGCGKQGASDPTAPPSNPLEQAGIPLYPGATSTEAPAAVPSPNGSVRIGADYLTSDSAEKVVDFYRDKLGLMSASPNGKLIQMVGKLPSGAFVQIYISPAGAQTKISFMVVTAPKS